MKRPLGIVAFAASILLVVDSIWAKVPPADGGLAGDVRPLSMAEIEADWLHQDALRQPGRGVGMPQVSCQEDAAGGVDGVKNGKWGFHTQYEPNPWWQVDLERQVPIDRVLLYNRCDLPDRIAQVMVLLSNDGKTFRKVWQNHGTIFYGFTDNKPLEVMLGGASARFVRLQLPGTSYFHLDEVEVFAVGESRNAALGKPAGQSSVSQWSVRHGERGRRWHRRLPSPPFSNEAASWPRASVRWDRRSTARCEFFDQVAEKLRALPKNPPESVQRTLRAGPVGRAADVAGESALELRRDPIRQACPGDLPAHVRPVLRMVVPAGRRHFPAGRL